MLCFYIRVELRIAIQTYPRPEMLQPIQANTYRLPYHGKSKRPILGKMVFKVKIINLLEGEPSEGLENSSTTKMPLASLHGKSQIQPFRSGFKVPHSKPNGYGIKIIIRKTGDFPNQPSRNSIMPLNP
jgi:hypothetical protein